MSNQDAAIPALEGLAELGIDLSIDDYGTGQSTLSYLKHLPAREIKIDKSFILMLESNRSDQAMVRSTIELAHELGFKVVAEGVATAEILDLLRSYGRSEEHTSELQSLMRLSYAVFCLKQKTNNKYTKYTTKPIHN